MSAGAARRPLEPRPDPVPVGASPAMSEVLAAAADVAATSTTVLLLGESGTGKEVLARHIHARSPRAAGPWVAVNCAALPGELLESELFGHERGAFTGAADRRAGRFEQAHGGTLLLDEISEIPLQLQAKLLRVLQEREVDRIGGQRPVAVDVRIIATTNRDVWDMVRLGQFRSDLYYRINVFPIALPPLRDRPEDLPALSLRLLEERALELGRTTPVLSASALASLGRRAFPGNVRELENLLERAMVRCRGPVIEERHLEPAIAVAAPSQATGAPSKTAAAAPADLPEGFPIELAALERLAIAEALRRVGGNRTHAARLLGIGLRTLRNKLRAWRVEDPSWAAESAGRQLLPGADGRAAPKLASRLDAVPACRSQEEAA